jgi:hypothetical protein
MSTSFPVLCLRRYITLPELDTKSLDINMNLGVLEESSLAIIKGNLYMHLGRSERYGTWNPLDRFFLEYVDLWQRCKSKDIWTQLEVVELLALINRKLQTSNYKAGFEEWFEKPENKKFIYIFFDYRKEYSDFKDFKLRADVLFPKIEKSLDARLSTCQNVVSGLDPNNYFSFQESTLDFDTSF